MNIIEGAKILREKIRLQGWIDCPNCGGIDTSHWPFGRCMRCNGTGKVKQES